MGAENYFITDLKKKKTLKPKLSSASRFQIKDNRCEIICRAEEKSTLFQRKYP